MKTEQTERFANVCKELSVYFFALAPKPRTYKTSDDREEIYISSLDDLILNENDKEKNIPPCDLNDLRDSFSLFKKESEDNYSASDSGFVNKLIAHFLNDCLPFEKLLPSEEHFFKYKLFDEAELLYNFKAISREINQKYGYIHLMGDPLPF